MNLWIPYCTVYLCLMWVGEVVNQPQVRQLYHMLQTYATSCNLQQLFSGPLLFKQGLLPVISMFFAVYLFDAIWVQPCMFQIGWHLRFERESHVGYMARVPKQTGCKGIRI